MPTAISTTFGFVHMDLTPPGHHSSVRGMRTGSGKILPPIGSLRKLPQVKNHLHKVQHNAE